MARNQLREALRHLHQVLCPAGADDPTDDQVLARFLASGDETAFAVLVRRHGPMVLGVCRRILRHTQDVEDAFQATFLVLARKASSVAHRQALSSWLYRVAYRIAVDARIRNDRRRAREKQVDELPHPTVLPAEVQDWRTWLDHELNRLPERYRAVLVACDLEERSRKEAARLLGLAEGTLSSRLARGRSLLAKRMARYGLSLSGGTLAAVLSSDAPAALPVSLTSAVILAATGRGGVSASVGFLTKGALEAMFLTKLKWTIGVVMVAVALGASGLVYRVAGQSPPAAAEKEVRDKPPTELEILRREVELLKLKLEVVQEKQKAQERELHALRATAGKSAKQGGSENRRDLPTVRPGTQEKASPEIRTLREDGTPIWPRALQKREFKEARERVEAPLKEARKCLLSGKNPSDATLIDILNNLTKLRDTLDANLSHLSADEYVQATRYVRWLMNAALASLSSGQGKTKGISSAEEAKPKAQQETDAKRLERLRSELERWKDRAYWSERMSHPDRQYVTPAEAEADKARVREARLALQREETKVRFQRAESALKELREASEPQAKQRAAKELEKALKQLREKMDSLDTGSPPPIRP